MCICVCVCMKGGDGKQAESHGYCIRIQGNVQWGEKAIQVYRRVKQTHFLCVSKTEMLKHNNGLFGNILLPCNDLQLKPISSHMGLEAEHCFNVLFIRYRYILSYYFLLSVVKWWGCFLYFIISLQMYRSYMETYMERHMQGLTLSILKYLKGFQ